ncbi:MAG: Na/Pi symporter [Merdibacter sp.]
MSTTNFLSLLGGLALFLYGMQMMSSGLEAAAGDRMKEILEKLTSNRFLGVLVGAAITAVIQSSSATTVMTVGFVNAGMMSLTQAVWIIMGANIGTTITGQLIALDVGVIAPPSPSSAWCWSSSSRSRSFTSARIFACLAYCSSAWRS